MRRYFFFIVNIVFNWLWGDWLPKHGRFWIFLDPWHFIKSWIYFNQVLTIYHLMTIINILEERNYLTINLSWGYLKGDWVRICYVNISCSLRRDSHWFCPGVSALSFLRPLVVDRTWHDLNGNYPSAQNISQIFAPVLVLSVVVTKSGKTKFKNIREWLVYHFSGSLLN